MRNGLIILVFILCSSISLWAQDNMRIGGHLGWKGGYFHDKSYSPLDYQKSAATLSLDFISTFKTDSRIKASFRGDVGTLKTNVSSEFTNNSYLVELSAAYQHRVWHPSNEFSLWIGGGLRNSVESNFYPESSNFSFIASHTLRPEIDFEWRSKKHSIEGSLSLPFISFISRPSYTILSYYDEYHRSRLYITLQNISKVDLLFWDKYIDIDSRIAYYYRIKNNIDIGAGYNFAFKYCTIQEPISIIDNSIILKIRFKI